VKVRLFSRALAGVSAGLAVTAAGLIAPVASMGATGLIAPAQAAATTHTLRIMPLGDSITAGVGSSTRSSYRSDLRRKLVAAGMSVDFVGSQSDGVGFDNQHEGHGGWTIDRIAEQLDGWLATYRPDAVIVHLGTNNVTSGESGATIAAKLSALIDQIRAARPEAMIFVSKIIGSKVAAEKVVDHDYNSRMPAMLATKGSRVRLVDQSTVGGIDLLDRHHPNNFGYNKMTYNFYRAFERVYADGEAWPGTLNPYRLTTTYRCLWKPVVRDGEVRNSYYCGDWVLTKVKRVRDGVTVLADRWVTRRTVAVRYRAKVGGHYVTRTRNVEKWVGPGEFLNV
jgi:hypothetical protein